MSSVGATRFYRPVAAKLTGRELAFAGESLDPDYRRGTWLDVPDFDFAVPSSPHSVKTMRVALRGNNGSGDFEPEFFDMGPFQITYNFSRAVRDNLFPAKGALPYKPRVMGEYGARGWSYRMLYEFLCKAYNGGYPFVDTYFGQVFKTRAVYMKFRRIYEIIHEHIDAEQQSILMSLPRKKDGTPDMRYAVSKRYRDYKVWQDPVIKRDCKDIAGEIRDDIVVCLENGHIRLSKREVSRETKEARAKLIGLNPSRFFFASGRLIRHLNIYVEVGRTYAGV